MNATKWAELLKAFLQQLPSFVTFVACIVFVIARWKRYPRVSLILLIALIADLTTQVAFTFIYSWVPDWFLGTNYDYIAARNVFTVVGLIANTVTVLVVAFYLIAIFTRRLPRESV
jgi:hypothetical protein